MVFSMKTVFDILEEIEGTQGKNAKRDILKAHADNVLLKETFRLIRHPYINFWVGKVPKVKHVGGPGSLDTMLEMLLNGIKKCINRDVTGNEARDLLVTILQPMTDLELKWASRIILRNLRAGVGEGSCDEVWPGLVPSFECALADKVEWEVVNTETGAIRITSDLVYPVEAQPKFDGFRCISIKKDGIVTSYQRSGNICETAPKVHAWLTKHMQDGWVVDGENIAEDNWNDTASVISSRVNRKDDAAIVYYVWDTMPLEVWETQSVSKPFSQRMDDIKAVLGDIPTGAPVKSVRGKVISSEVELLAYYHECLEQGHEGVMVKRLDAPYEFKRGKAMLKLKPVADFDGVVVGVELGKPGTKWADKHISLIVRFPFSCSGKDTRVVTGTNDEQKAFIDTMRDKLIGEPLTVEGSPVLGKDGKVRFPVFAKWRVVSDCAPEVRRLVADVTGNDYL